MNGEVLSQLMTQMLLAVLYIAGPVLLFSLITGIVVSIIQVVTQIQDVSIAFVSKLFTVFLIMLLCGGWMLKSLVSYAISVFNTIPFIL